jgi:GMP synthase-like glutamine amidotransferase
LQICFGHQIVARAFGANVIKNPEGWELGVRTIQLTPMGQKLLARNEETAKVSQNWTCRCKAEEVQNIEQVHQDHVTSIPPGFHNLAFTPICPFQGLVRFSSAPSLSASREELFAQINVFTLQGHPEFTADIGTCFQLRRAKESSFGVSS